MPGDGICSRFEKIVFGIVVRTAVHEMNLWVTLRGPSGGMNVQPAKIATIFESFVDRHVGEVLIVKDFGKNFCQSAARERRGNHKPRTFL